MDAGTAQLQQFNLLLLLAGAEDHAQGRIFTLAALVFIQPVQVELHLSLECGLEFTQFEFNCHQPAQAPMVEEQVHVEVIAIQGDALGVRGRQIQRPVPR